MRKKMISMIGAISDKEIVIFEGEDIELPENHDCDIMGCSSIVHVAYRFKKQG